MAKGATVFQTNRAYGQWTRDEVLRGAATPAQWSVNVATQIADQKLLALRNNLLGMGVATIDSMDTPSANYHIIDDSRGKIAGARAPFTFVRMNALLAKMGDARENIKAFAFHSSVLKDLIKDGLSTYGFDSVAGMLIKKDEPLAMGRTLIVVDSSALYSALTSSYYTEYYVLGLAEGALQATIIADDEPVEKTVITTKVKTYQIRQDYDVDYSVQGMQWITPGTNINPTDAELLTAARWDEYLSDHRECGIVKGIYNTLA